MGGRKGIRPVKTEQWGAGVVICLERGADLHMVQLMPLPLTVSCFSKIQTGFAFLVPAHPGSPGQRAVRRVCVFVLRQRVELRGGLLQEWPGAVTARREVFQAVAEQYQAGVDKDARKYGECLARLRVRRTTYLAIQILA